MKYRKKPTIIEAFQMTKEARMDNSNWPNWMHEAWQKGADEEGSLTRADFDAEMPDELCIVTLEGKMHVSWGDYIIQGTKGELYPCKPDIFEALHEKV